MLIRPFTASDLPTVHAWWQEQGWPAIPLNMLPTTGWIVEGLCAGWLYQANSAVAKLEWVVGNPAAPKEDRSKALDCLINYTSNYAKERGYAALFTSTKHKGLIERLKRLDYVVGDEGVTHLVKQL